jgi:hypothetical protein
LPILWDYIPTNNQTVLIESILKISIQNNFSIYKEILDILFQCDSQYFIEKLKQMYDTSNELEKEILNDYLSYLEIEL